jgi:hypothetical protein
VNAKALDGPGTLAKLGCLFDDEDETIAENTARTGGGRYFFSGDIGIHDWQENRE